jgi:hypothetical protein
MSYAGFSLKENFTRPPCRREVAAAGACGRGHAEGRDCSRDKRNQISDFLQEIVVWTLALWPPQSKSNLL